SVSREVRGHAIETLARQWVLAAVDQRHAPRLDLLLMYDDTVFRHVEGNVRHMQGIVRKVFLDYVPFVAAADHEIVGAMRRVELHDVPEDWLAADLDHRLGSEIALLGNTSAKAASKNDDFHGKLSSAGRHQFWGGDVPPDRAVCAD